MNVKNVIHQIDRKNEWLLLSLTSTAKFELVFVFFLGSHFKANRKSMHSSKKRLLGFSK